MPAFEGYADLPGLRLWYTDSGGSGVPVVLLHAFTGNADSWAPNRPGLVAAGYRAIGFDRRGWGRSTANPPTGPQPGTAAEDLNALADHLGLDRFHLVGIAAGGSVAYDYALWHPARLRSLVVAASGGGIQDEELRELRSKTQLPAFQEWPPELREVSQGYRATNPAGLEQWLQIQRHSRQRDAPTQPLRTPITLTKLETIRLPTLILAADQDLSWPPWLMRRQAAHIPGVEFRLIPEAGHAANWEQPELFNSGVLDFVGRH